VAQGVESPPSKHEALSTTKKKKGNKIKGDGVKSWFGYIEMEYSRQVQERVRQKLPRKQFLKWESTITVRGTFSWALPLRPHSNPGQHVPFSSLSSF
jgi:hypothetical protein